MMKKISLILLAIISVAAVLFHGGFFGAAIYFILWFLSIFLVLPFGVVTQAEQGVIEKGTSHSAPAENPMPVKLLLTTIVAALIYFLVNALLDTNLIAALTDLIYDPIIMNGKDI